MLAHCHIAAPVNTKSEYQGVCLQVCIKQRELLLQEILLLQCWSQETKLDPQGVEIQRRREKVDREMLMKKGRMRTRRNKENIDGEELQ